jgi:plastocyanin
VYFPVQQQASFLCENVLAKDIKLTAEQMPPKPDINSGLMPTPGMQYTLTIGLMTFGPLPYACSVHDISGMTGQLIVV